LTRGQYQRIADTLTHVGEIVFAGSAVAPLFGGGTINPITIVVGVIFSIVLFLIALYVEGKVKD
jgi:hypothetical protein